MKSENQSHWDTVYATKQPHEVSWTQDIPQTSLDFIHSFNIPKSAKIIDIGGGDSHLVDYLLAEGYKNITVLDISEKALARAKERLGKKAAKVQWIVSDITTFKPKTQYDVWHDRATFHFLTENNHIKYYKTLTAKAVKGYLTIGTFSKNGPEKCSGLPIKQYDETALIKELSTHFDKIRCINEDHITPFGTQQNFTFCSFKHVNHVASAYAELV
jgi:cyclopropane fatty-acyl-phospholipid synthase-like methyltransferase